MKLPPAELKPIDLQAGLQAAVGNTYRILRELGGGGMSRVFLAEEPRLGREVVIKVLPPDMGAGVSAERFEREIQLAAGLQHPHIVPLLTAGASGDLLYYIMPHIRGESLRVKLAREGELPVTDAVRMLREVVDALAYAHRHGVVHRDIKPDNVLLSESHAVVTDFGVAKAIASGGSGSFTSLGVALGTPAYMAPEQAAADPHLDHRADIYAVGVLGYEMLTGRTPFIAPTPQALLAAHLTQTPDPASQHRPTIPLALNALIMRCLEKRPADRWQSALEISSQLEAMSTPTAGHAAIPGAPALTASAERALRRSHPGRVALLFTLASAGVLALVYLLVQQLGLPDWVWQGAIVLLLIGLPIMLITSFHERRRASARTVGHGAPPTSGPVAHWFTWRRALLGGALAFAGLSVVALIYTAMRLLGIGPVGTLVASGVLEDRDLLLLADFENRTADSTLGHSLTEAFRVDLSQSPNLRLVDPQVVSSALERLQRPPGASLTQALARDVAQREGVKAVVTGQIDPVGPGYSLSAALIGAADGRVLTAVRDKAADQAGLLEAIDRLSSKIRERIGESLRSIRANPPLEQVTTGSLPALRKYSQAVRLFDEGGSDEEVISLLQDAIALDTAFAMAYRKLAAALGNTLSSRGQEFAAATQAFRHRDRLPPLERELASGYYYSSVEYDPSKQMAAYRAALAIDPDEGTALNNLAITLSNQRRFVEAESLIRRALRTGNSPPYYTNGLVVLLGQGRGRSADSLVQAFSRVSPGSTMLRLLRSSVAVAQGDYPAAERDFRLARNADSSDFFVQFVTNNRLAVLGEMHGRLADARKETDRLIAFCERRNNLNCVIDSWVDRALLDVVYYNRGAEAVAVVDSVLARYPLQSLPPLDRPYSKLTYLHARAGNPARARRLWQEYQSSPGYRGFDINRHLAAGSLAEAEGRTGDALVAYRDWFQTDGFCGACGLYQMATVFDRAGQTDSALVYYQRMLTTPGMARLTVDGPGRAPTFKRLGELYEGRGDRSRAAEYYGRFVDLWKNADPELQPAVREVRLRMARLSQEAGS